MPQFRRCWYGHGDVSGQGMRDGACTLRNRGISWTLIPYIDPINLLTGHIAPRPTLRASIGPQPYPNMWGRGPLETVVPYNRQRRPAAISPQYLAFLSWIIRENPRLWVRGRVCRGHIGPKSNAPEFPCPQPRARGPSADLDQDAMRVDADGLAALWPPASRSATCVCIGDHLPRLRWPRRSSEVGTLAASQRSPPSSGQQGLSGLDSRGMLRMDVLNQTGLSTVEEEAPWSEIARCSMLGQAVTKMSTCSATCPLMREIDSATQIGGSVRFSPMSVPPLTSR